MRQPDGLLEAIPKVPHHLAVRADHPQRLVVLDEDAPRVAHPRDAVGRLERALGGAHLEVAVAVEDLDAPVLSVDDDDVAVKVERDVAERRLLRDDASAISIRNELLAFRAEGSYKDCLSWCLVVQLLCKLECHHFAVTHCKVILKPTRLIEEHNDCSMFFFVNYHNTTIKTEFMCVVPCVRVKSCV